MIITIQLDTENRDDIHILDRLFIPVENRPPAPAKASDKVVETPDPVPAKAAEVPPKAPAPAKAKPAPAPAPAPAAEPELDLLEEAPPAAELREQAVLKATELVTTGQSQKVRDALAAAGAKRVSDLTDDQLEGFLAAVA